MTKVETFAHLQHCNGLINVAFSLELSGIYLIWGIDDISSQNYSVYIYIYISVYISIIELKLNLGNAKCKILHKFDFNF